MSSQLHLLVGCNRYGVYVAAAGPPIAADGTSPCEIFQPPNRGELIAPWTTGGGADKSRSRQIVAKAVNQLTKNCSVRHTNSFSPHRSFQSSQLTFKARSQLSLRNPSIKRLDYSANF